jgi:hypothetical protein
MNPLRTDRSRHRADAHLRAIVAPGLRVADSPRVPSRAPRRAAVVLSRASRALQNVIASSVAISTSSRTARARLYTARVVVGVSFARVRWNGNTRANDDHCVSRARRRRAEDALAAFLARDAPRVVVVVVERHDDGRDDE